MNRQKQEVYQNWEWLPVSAPVLGESLTRSVAPLRSTAHCLQTETDSEIWKLYKLHHARVRNVPASSSEGYRFKFRPDIGYLDYFVVFFSPSRQMTTWCPNYVKTISCHILSSSSFTNHSLIGRSVPWAADGVVKWIKNNRNDTELHLTTSAFVAICGYIHKFRVWGSRAHD